MLMKKLTSFLLILAAHTSLWAAIESNLSVSAGLSYDNNILQLSKMYIDEFTDNTKPQRYSISSIDDMVVGALATAGTGVTYAGGWKSGITLSFDGDFYTRNKVCNYYLFKGTFYQRIPGFFWIYFKYQYAPNKYVADYFVDEYESMTYKEDKFSLSVRRKFFDRLTLCINGAYGRAYYNKYFMRYDNNKKAAGGEIALSYKPFDCELTYLYTGSQKIERPASTPKDLVTDGSYNENSIGCNINIRLPKIKKFNHYISTGYSFDLRNYTSGFSEDKYHNGRVDKKNSIRLSYCTTFRKHFSIDLFCISTFRQTNSKIYMKIADEKSFSQLQAGVKISSDLKLK
jgi:hypothetical protein